MTTEISVMYGSEKVKVIITLVPPSHNIHYSRIAATLISLPEFNKIIKIILWPNMLGV